MCLCLKGLPATISDNSKLALFFISIRILDFKYWNVLALDGSNWQYVDLFNFQTDVSGYVVENLAKRCREFLKAIRLENCRWINDNSIKLLFNACRNIEILNLRQCIKLTDNAFIDLGSNLAQLKNVNLESCFVGDGGVEAIARGCPNLESIDLSWCKNVTRFALEKLAGSCPKLKYFSSRGLASVTNLSMIFLHSLSSHFFCLIPRCLTRF